MSFSSFLRQKLPGQRTWLPPAFLLLFLFPLGLLSAWLEFSLKQELTSAREAARRELSRDLYEVRLGIEGNDFFNQLATEASEQANPPKFLFLEFAKLKKAFPGMFEVVIFDRKGNLLPKFSDLSEHHRVLKTFGKLLPGALRRNTEKMIAFFPRIKPILGNCLPNFEALRYYGIYRSSILPNRSFVFMPSSNRLPHFIVWIRLPKSPNVFFSRLRIWEKRFALADSHYRIVDLSRDLPPQGAELGPFGESLEKALIALGDRKIHVINQDGTIWGKAQLDKQSAFVIVRHDPFYSTFVKETRVIRECGLLIFIGMVFLVILLFRPNRLKLSLASKVFSLFLYATGLPLLLLAISSQALFQERLAAKENQIRRQHERIMEQVNEDFSNYLSLIEGKMREMARNALPEEEKGLSRAVQLARNFIAIFLPNSALVFDWRGKVLHRQYYNELWPVFRKTLDLYVARLAKDIARINGVRPPAGKFVEEEILRGFLAGIGQDLDQFVARWCAMQDRMFSVPLIKRFETEMMLHFFRDREGKIKAGGIFVWARRLTIKDWFLNYARRMRQKWPTRHFYIVGEGVHDVGMFQSNLLGNFPLSTAAKQLSAPLQFQPVPIHRFVSLNGQGYYLSGVTLKIEEETRLFIASSDKEARQEVAQTKKRILGIGITMFLLAMMVSILLIQHFLAPIRNLRVGLQALKERQFAYRIPVLSHDELGKLSENFNHLLEGMADLEVGKVVQDTFFPKKTLSGNGWQVFGSSVSASRVGGDYFDYFPIPDGRWLLLIGDVSGHGVSAALVVAMAKATIKMPREKFKPAEIMAELNRLLKSMLWKKKMMSCWIGVFDPSSGVLLSANAGHQYPLRIRHGAVAELPVRSLLLGAKSKEPYKEKSFTLEPGDCLCLYTDGLPEALVGPNQMLGYETFYNELPSLKGETAQITEGNIRRWHAKSIMAPNNLEDDITLVVLQRCSEKL